MPKGSLWGNFGSIFVYFATLGVGLNLITREIVHPGSLMTTLRELKDFAFLTVSGLPAKMKAGFSLEKEAGLLTLRPTLWHRIKGYFLGRRAEDLFLEKRTREELILFARNIVYSQRIHPEYRQEYAITVRSLTFALFCANFSLDRVLSKYREVFSYFTDAELAYFQVVLEECTFPVSERQWLTDVITQSYYLNGRVTDIPTLISLTAKMEKRPNDFFQARVSAPPSSKLDDFFDTRFQSKLLDF